MKEYLTYAIDGFDLLSALDVRSQRLRKQQTALVSAAGSGAIRDRTGVVTFTNASGQQTKTNEILLPWMKEIEVEPGQTISVTVNGHSPAHLYFVQIEVGYKGEHEIVVKNQGAGGQDVGCTCVIGGSPSEATGNTKSALEMAESNNHQHAAQALREGGAEE